MKAAISFIILLIVFAFWGAIGYKAGELQGRADLDRWMQTNNVMKIHTVESCSHPLARQKKLITGEGN